MKNDRSSRLIAAFVVGLIALGSSRCFAGSTSAGHEWFQFDPVIAGNWEVIPESHSTSALTFRSVDTATKEGKHHHVLALYAKPSSAYDVAISQMARVFGQKSMRVDIRVVNYDNKDTIAQSAIFEAERDGFDLIVGMGSEATSWLWKNYHGGRLPVVSVCAKDPVLLGQTKSYNEATGTNFALTSLNLPADVQMAYALELMPKMRNLAIIVDSKNLSAVQTQAEPMAAQARARGIRVLELQVQDPNRAAEELGPLVSHAVESMRLSDVNLEDSLFLITGSTSVFQEMKTINANASRVPVVSMVPENVQAGDESAVLSIGVSFRSNAHLAAIYAAEVLDGLRLVGSLKVGVLTPPDIAINFRRAREIGLKIPFSFFENANVVYDYSDKMVRSVSSAEQ